MDDALFAEAVDLRDRVLRAPLGRASARHETERDAKGVHFVALRSSKVVGCLALYPDGAAAAELKSMAVAPEARREGVGAAMYRCLEGWARGKGIGAIAAEARIGAVAFYESCGFTAESEDYMLHGVQHRRMRKLLAADRA
ncbi:MAG: GNAT family N-acetyltransferase [Parvularculaceae bacterium]|nr:GNAT family N-acetyltransferase [Parvularculaceae bacterium]